MTGATGPDPRVSAVQVVGAGAGPEDGAPEQRAEILRYAGAVAALGDGPVWRAIAAADRAANEAADDGDARPELEVGGFVAHADGGAEGLVRRAHAGLAPGGLLNTRRVLLGPPAWLAGQGVTVPPEVAAAVGPLDGPLDEQGAADAVAVAWHGAVRGVITLRTAPSGTS
ncbi:hypothetical protein ACFQHV_05890 [Promicromonospora thailandica]|uniref:Uncharacterized protein n=1 Tax=Promicromonospora thailandica TaxID=765201 RepID=A0A9X2G4X0_9MICO|nr:hypothetical protein [Promicromonospora thailandica]MCP2263349.1 hypothetical protein [Promicromonospora thailandica]